MMKAFQNIEHGGKDEIILNEDGQPTFGLVSKLSQIIGIEARVIPVTYKTWKNVPLHVKDNLYSRILV